MSDGWWAFWASVSFVAGFFIGILGSEMAWKKDCDKIGAHRSDDVVYDCKRQVTR